MCRPLLSRYIKAHARRPHSVRFPLSSRMNVSYIIIILFFIFFALLVGQRIPSPSTVFSNWMVIGSNSSGNLYWRSGDHTPHIFVWKPNNETIRPTFYYGTPPTIVPDAPTTIAPETSTTIVQTSSTTIAPETLMTTALETSTGIVSGTFTKTRPCLIQSALEVSKRPKPS